MNQLLHHLETQGPALSQGVLAQMYRSGQFAQLYQEWIGSVGIKPSPMLVAMFQLNALTD